MEDVEDIEMRECSREVKLSRKKVQNARKFLQRRRQEVWKESEKKGELIGAKDEVPLVIHEGGDGGNTCNKRNRSPSSGEKPVASVKKVRFTDNLGGEKEANGGKMEVGDEDDDDDEIQFLGVFQETREEEAEVLVSSGGIMQKVELWEEEQTVFGRLMGWNNKPEVEETREILKQRKGESGMDTKVRNYLRQVKKINLIFLRRFVRIIS